MEEEKNSEQPSSLENIIAEAIRFKALAADLDSQVKSARASYDECMKKILSLLDAMGLDSIRAQGFLFYKETRSSITTPKTIEEKRQLFEFLKSKGMFEELVSVNSQTLNALYKDLASTAAESGELEFKLPGCGEPKSDINLRMKKG